MYAAQFFDNSFISLLSTQTYTDFDTIECFEMILLSANTKMLEMFHFDKIRTAFDMIQFQMDAQIFEKKIHPRSFNNDQNVFEFLWYEKKIPKPFQAYS